MNGIKNYLVQNGEGALNDVIEEERKHVSTNICTHTHTHIHAQQNGIKSRACTKSSHCTKCFTDEIVNKFLL